MLNTDVDVERMGSFHRIAKELDMDVITVMKLDIPLLEGLLAGVRSNLALSATRAEENIPDEYNKDQFAAMKTASMAIEGLFGNKTDEEKRSGAKNLRAK